MSEKSSMEYDMDELEVLEVTESDAALLRELLEELENEEMTMNKNDNNASDCLVQPVADDNNEQANETQYVLEEETFVAERNDSCIYDSASWPLEMMESTGCSSLQPADVSVPDWYVADGAVGVMGFECGNPNTIGDYSYLSNEITYNCLWEEDIWLN